MHSEYRNRVIEYVSENKADGLVLVASIFLFHLMLVAGSIQIINRYVGIPFGVYWAGEVTRTAMVFLTLVLVPYLFVHQLDISFLPVLKQVFGTRRKYVLLVRNAFLSAFVALMVWSSYLAYLQSGDVTFPTVRWFPVRWVYALMGMAFLGLLGYVLIDTKRRMTAAIAGTEPEERSDV